MINREDLSRWDSAVEPRLINQAVIDASERIRDVGFVMDPQVSYRELIQSINGLAERMPSSIILGRSDEYRSMLFTAALEVFDHSTMAQYLEDFEEMFALSVSDLRLQRDTRRCDVSALPRLCSSLARNIHVMAPSAYRKLLENSMSFTIQYRQHAASRVGTSLFFVTDEGMSDYTQIFNDMVLSAIVKQGVGLTISSDALGMPGRVEHALRTARAFTLIEAAGINMQAWQFDRLLIVQVVERLIQAHKIADRSTERDDLSRGVKAITNVFTRQVGEPPLIGGNCFRPCLHPKDWKVWMDARPMEILTRHLDLALKGLGHNECPVIEDSIGRIRLQLLIDATICAKSLAPKAGKQTKDRQESAAAIGDFVRELIHDCEEPMSRDRALNGLNHELKVVLVGLLPAGDVRKDLLRANKRVKGQVLMDDLGL